MTYIDIYAFVVPTTCFRVLLTTVRSPVPHPLPHIIPDYQ